MSDYKNNRQGYFRIEKKFLSKVEHIHKTRGHLCPLSQSGIIHGKGISIYVQ